MHLFTATLSTETNTFSPVPRGLRSYDDYYLRHGTATRDAPNLSLSEAASLAQRAYERQMGFSDRGADCKLLFGVSMFLPALWFSSRLTPGRRMLAFGTWVPQCNRRSTLNQGCLPIYEVTNAIVPAGT